MCLYTKQKRAQVAKKPITIYKYLKCECLPGLNSARYETPYTHTKVSGDIIDGRKSMEAFGVEFFEHYDNLYCITMGFIHAFTSKQRALDCKPSDDCVLFKCEIPAGTEYYKSLSEFGEICAKKINFIKVIQ